MIPDTVKHNSASISFRLRHASKPSFLRVLLRKQRHFTRSSSDHKRSQQSELDCGHYKTTPLCRSVTLLSVRKVYSMRNQYNNEKCLGQRSPLPGRLKTDGKNSFDHVSFTSFLNEPTTMCLRHRELFSRDVYAQRSARCTTAGMVKVVLDRSWLSHLMTRMGARAYVSHWQPGTKPTGQNRQKCSRVCVCTIM